ncbi:hypothetical protein [Nitratidesulfovibrio vulgaris]|jgi:uncharacterized membrane protein YidH (DUF202 family)|uniref:Uncharacterized protein n=1 Tax=Nitratidesulfovibrio vulgaris (strain DP4) TaxID=391774 RepID=A0A0H3A7M2_NITV4|nr:hypothetical protein [Nitratidesulfovibrio vulgaris]GEB80436.1 hypothetical protein DDE01_18510 [Desulfovibrio desulfuricans]HBW16770.1 hypothetical protein [Desulfovibrio sp.]ABM28168.1 conserved hypothetical protein [Nitratidesulfovibrio vulgaris DP4]ADP87081.1 hypothetical protein Deval_1933 [Nitratidesulfovibrio vulgaris RCH1]WCB45605.1 hypothetical protein PH214_11080 [Nitratidesulfovibrio vulgaris]
MEESVCEEIPEAIRINEAQLILAEKRTSLAVLRTGIAVCALPLSLTTFLIATSRYWQTSDVLHLLLPLSILNIGVFAFGAYLAIRAMKRIRHEDAVLAELKAAHPALSRFIG